VSRERLAVKGEGIDLSGGRCVSDLIRIQVAAKEYGGKDQRQGKKQIAYATTNAEEGGKAILPTIL